MTMTPPTTEAQRRLEGTPPSPDPETPQREFARKLMDIGRIASDEMRANHDQKRFMEAFEALKEHDARVAREAYEKGHHDTLNGKFPALKHAGCDACVDKTVMSLADVERVSREARIAELKKIAEILIEANGKNGNWNYGSLRSIEKTKQRIAQLEAERRHAEHQHKVMEPTSQGCGLCASEKRFEELLEAEQAKDR